MAFTSKVGNILRQTATKQVNAGLSASGPSIYQAIRCMSSSKLFVGGISFSTDDSSLREAFGKYGEVIEASSEDASTAIQALDGQVCRLDQVGVCRDQVLNSCYSTLVQAQISNQSNSTMQSIEDIGDARKHQIGKNVSRKDKIHFLVNTLLDLKDSKESVYGALDAWVAWEKNFPIASLKKALLALEKEQEWHRVVQVIKWMLSKGQGTTMGTYEQLIRALDMDHRAEEAHMFWEKKIGMDLHSVPWQLCKLMISVYYRNNMLQNLIMLFKGLEAFDRKPPEKSIVQKVADAYEVLGMLDEKESLLVKYNDLFIETAKGSTKKSRIASKRKNKSADRKDVSTSNDVSSAASDVP